LRLSIAVLVPHSLVREAHDAAQALGRRTVGDNVMYFETGQGSALPAVAQHGCYQQTLEARAYGVARLLKPLLVNTVVGFIGPEYLVDGKRIIGAVPGQTESGGQSWSPLSWPGSRGSRLSCICADER